MKNLVLVFALIFSMSAFSAEIDKRFISTAFTTLLGEKTSDDVAEGTTNLYYTTARFDDNWASKTSDDLTEGTTNLYYTDARAQAAVSATAPLSYDGLGGFSISQASSGSDGYLSAADFGTFSAKMSNPLTDVGQLIYGGVGGNPEGLFANLTATKMFLSSTGTGTEGQAPVWSTLSASDVGLGSVTNDAQVAKSSYTLGTILVGTGAGTYSAVGPSTAGYVLTSNGTTLEMAALPAAAVPYKEVKTLIAGDVTAQYFDLAEECVASSLVLILDGASALGEGKDYSVSVVSNKTRISFIGDIASAGATPVIAGDIFRAQCVK